MSDEPPNDETEPNEIDRIRAQCGPGRRLSREEAERIKAEQDRAEFLHHRSCEKASKARMTGTSDEPKKRSRALDRVGGGRGLMVGNERWKS